MPGGNAVRAESVGSVFALLILLVGVAGARSPLFDFEQGLPHNLILHDARADLVMHAGSQALQVRFQKAEWPNVFFQAESPWDWSNHAALAVDVTNLEKQPITVAMRVDNDGADGLNNCKTADANVPPGETITLTARFNAGANRFWGMRGIPEVGEVATGNQLDPARVVAFQVFLSRPDEEHTLILDNIRLVGNLDELEAKVSLPFVDRFGQYMHAEWPGKLNSDEDFAARKSEEHQQWVAQPRPAGQDAWGGWADGPQLEATGWFRTEQRDGVWWLVTPQGRLFFSIGMDCVNTGDQTFVTGRDGWFEGLPEKDDPDYGRFYGHVDGVHSMAETIGGKGDTFSFYRANLRRKYGKGWMEAWRDASYARLRHWGFNTLGAWTDGSVTAPSPMPFTVSLGSGRGGRGIEGARGYWGPMVDAYDPAFVASTDSTIAAQVEPYKENPYCIGYFVDNEIGWETIRTGTLASPVDQPCRVAFVEMLKSKYGAIGALNAAWGVDAADWDTLRNPAFWKGAAEDDMNAFIHAFARRYFETIRDALRAHAPHHLYLGCRFATAPPQAVQACAEVADVVSYNLYYRYVPCEKWSGADDLGKPIIIGEFHFGALDRGMFHTGLREAPDQAARAEYFRDYVRSVAECPAFVGCHWFQYVDEPLTGRVYDGENYAIGFVSVTDTPYAEMVDASQEISGRIYDMRTAIGRK